MHSTAPRRFQQRHGARKEPVHAFFVLRSVACLGVVLIHALSIGLRHPGDTDPKVLLSLASLQMLLMFSTPAFVFLSAALVGHAYDRPPARFLTKRGRFVLLPFVSMSAAYAIFNVWRGQRERDPADSFTIEFIERLAAHLAGGSHLWFILPIFQFYILYVIVGTWFGKIPPKVGLTVSLLVNIAYLGFFNFAAPFDHGYARLVGTHWYAMLFPAWLFYFALGYYVGRYYLEFQAGLQKHIAKICIALISSAGLMLGVHFSRLMADVSSKRVDVVFYTACVIAVVLFVAERRKSVHPLIVRLSQFSFGIYILHPFFLWLTWNILQTFPPVPMPVYVLLLWTVGSVASFAATDRLGRLRFGPIFLGKVGVAVPVREHVDATPSPAIDEKAVKRA